MRFYTCAHAHRIFCAELARCNKTLFCLLWIWLNLIHPDSILQHGGMLCVSTIPYLWFSKRNYEYQASAYPLLDGPSVKRNHGGASRITSPPYGIVLIGHTASSQKIQKSLPAVLLWPVKGKERGRTDTQVTQGLAAKEKGEHSWHWQSWPKSQNDTQTLLQLPLLCKIDTGAEGNVVPVELYKRLSPQSSYSPEGAPVRRTNAFKYNHYCLRGSHHTVIWHLWARADTITTPPRMRSM